MKRSIIFGCISCLLGIGTGYYFRSLDHNLPILKGISVFTGSFAMWLFVVERPHKWTLNRGAIAGILGAILSHYLSAYIGLLQANYEYWALGKQIGSLPGPPINPLIGIFCMLFNTFLTLLVIGWFTVPVNGLLGAAYIKLLCPHESKLK